MSAEPPKEGKDAAPHIDIVTLPPSNLSEGTGSPALRDSKGWDGKLRVPRSATLANPEALTDSEYDDDDNVIPGEQIQSDEDLLQGEDPQTDEIIRTQCRIGSIPPLGLERFKQVARICLRQNLIHEIEGLEGLADTLQELDLYDNMVSHVRGLDALTNLTFLDLSFNKIKHIKRINHLKHLKELYLVANKITKIENLEGLDNLKSLELGSNRIRQIENLAGLNSLEDLWVAKNKIAEISGLAGLPSLRLLSIQSNRIRDLSPLSQAPQLEELYISHNALESLEGLERNVNLQTIDISNNQVKSLKGLGPLKNLQELWASYNQIADFQELEEVLADKKDLNTVYFEGNPLQLRNPALYRNKVRLALPQLKQIDATFVKI